MTMRELKKKAEQLGFAIDFTRVGSYIEARYLDSRLVARAKTANELNNRMISRVDGWPA